MEPPVCRAFLPNGVTTTISTSAVRQIMLERFERCASSTAAGIEPPKSSSTPMTPRGALSQSPSQTSSDSGGWYDTKLAATRCRAHYEYDAGGRLYWLGHYWDTLSNNTYSTAAIYGQYCDYELNTGLNRGVKLDAKY